MIQFNKLAHDLRFAWTIACMIYWLYVWLDLAIIANGK